ncbi:MAG: co-chaperone GroES family protein [Bacteroidota bacterium]
MATDLILIGDRVLIRPEDPSTQTSSGLYLPATVKQKERIQSGRVLNVGPGYLTANPEFTDEPWAATKSAVRYLPLQASIGDFAFFLRKEAIDLQFQDEDLLIVPHSAIVALLRDLE